jgi:hypothetical protein
MRPFAGLHNQSALMSVSRNRRKKQRKRDREGPVFFKNPLSNIPRDALLKGLAEIGDSAQERFTADVSKVIDLTKSVDALHTIATLAVYGLFVAVTGSGYKKRFQEGNFSQSYVELLQAVFLQIPEQQGRLRPARPDQIQMLFDTLPELAQSFFLQRLRLVDHQASDQAKAVVYLQEFLRGHTQTVRNWGYYKRVVSIIKRLLRPLDQLFRDQIGLTATGLIKTFEFLVTRTEEQVNKRWSKYSEILAERTVGKVIKRYYELNPNLIGTREQLIEFAEGQHLAIDEVKILILSHSDLTLSDDLTFNVAAVANELGQTQGALTAVLEKLSLSFGDLADRPTEGLFLNNPVWTKPLIKLADEMFFCATPQVFFSFIFPILEELIAGKEPLRGAYRRRRAEFMESEIKTRFREAFPDSEIATNYRWRDATKEYENDLLIKIDSHLILVEAKSGAVSWPALRGAPDRAKRHVEELLLEPSNQSLRLAARINEVIANPAVAEALLPNFPVDLKTIKTVLRLSVTLEDFGVLQSQLHTIKPAGWIPEDHPLAPCILLADLEIVFDILELTALKIHYLKRRSELEANMNYNADEMDLLGFYLLTGFNIGEAEFSKNHFQLTGMSKNIDEYYTSLDNDMPATRPQPKLTKWWRDICAKLEERKFYQWSDAANILLSFSFSEQEKAEKYFAKIKKIVFRRWMEKDHKCSIMIIPNAHRSDALSLFAFRQTDRQERYKRMENIAAQAFGTPHVQRCLVLAVDIDDGHYPYSTLAVFRR